MGKKIERGSATLSINVVKHKTNENDIQINDALATQYWCPDLIVREALINVVSNAVKFTAEGGVDIEVKLGAANEMSDLSNVIFEVSDSGPGIPESRRAQVFAPFETGVTLETEGTGGTGLGLSSTKNNLKSIGQSMLLVELC